MSDTATIQPDTEIIDALNEKVVRYERALDRIASDTVMSGPVPGFARKVLDAANAEAPISGSNRALRIENECLWRAYSILDFALKFFVDLDSYSPAIEDYVGVPKAKAAINDARAALNGDTP